MGDNLKEREAFEAWASQITALARKGDRYEEVMTSLAWEAWNARAALAQAQSLPAGWKLVPVDPSIAACINGSDAVGRAIDGKQCAKVYRAMLAASPAQTVRPSDLWLPIETAPRNGTHVLLWEQWSEDPFVGWWDSGEWRASHEHVDAAGGWDGAVVIDRIECQVTHWMPLPPAPQPKD